MVTTRAFLSSLSRTVIGKPRLIIPALRLYNATRAREARGLGRLFPSRRYLQFRIYTQYGHEEVSKETLREDVATYLEWTMRQR